MANTIVTQTIFDGSKKTIIKVTILGDGSGEETDKIIFDASTYIGAGTSNKLIYMEYCLNGFSAYLEWDADTDIILTALATDHPYKIDYTKNYNSDLGGIRNNSGTGITGDVLINTTGLGNGDVGHIILELYKD